MLSTLDIISNARVELGMGAGWYEQEYVAYGYQFPANVSRIKQLDESLSIIKAMWKDKCASFEGKYYRIIDLAIHGVHQGRLDSRVDCQK